MGQEAKAKAALDAVPALSAVRYSACWALPLFSPLLSLSLSFLAFQQEKKNRTLIGCRQNTRFQPIVMKKLARCQRGVFLSPFELMYFRRGKPSPSLCFTTLNLLSDLHHMRAEDLQPHLDSLEQIRAGVRS